MVKLRNLSDRSFWIAGDVKLSPKSDAEVEQKEAERLVGMYAGELEIVGGSSKPAKQAESDETVAPADLTAKQLKAELDAAGVAYAPQAPKADLVAAVEKVREAPKADLVAAVEKVREAAKAATPPLTPPVAPPAPVPPSTAPASGPVNPVTGTFNPQL